MRVHKILGFCRLDENRIPTVMLRNNGKRSTNDTMHKYHFMVSIATNYSDTQLPLSLSCGGGVGGASAHFSPILVFYFNDVSLINGWMDRCG